MKKLNLLERYENICFEIAKEFWSKYFKNEELDAISFENEFKRNSIYSIADQYDGIWQIYDYFFSLSDMVIALRHEATSEQLFEWYDYTLEKESKQNLENFLKYGLIKNGK